MEFQGVDPRQAEDKADKEEMLNRLHEEAERRKKERALEVELVERQRKEYEKRLKREMLLKPQPRFQRRIPAAVAPPVAAAGHPGVN